MAQIHFTAILIIARLWYFKNERRPIQNCNDFLYIATNCNSYDNKCNNDELEKSNSHEDFILLFYYLVISPSFYNLSLFLQANFC